VVAAISPQEDAIVQLAVAPAMAPEQAMRKFASLQGVQVGTPSAGAINGFPAQSAPFQARTDQGVVEGMVTFLSYGGNTYQLVGYTPQGRLATRAPELQRTIASFNALTDATALGVQPAKLELVRAPANMSIEQFNAQFPSTLPLDQLAVINGLDKGGQVTAGQWVKRVTGGVPGGK
jgi:predicted Zn-dependent protease